MKPNTSYRSLSPQATSRRRPLFCELLEERLNLSFSASMNGNILLLTGTNGDDYLYEITNFENHLYYRTSTGPKTVADNSTARSPGFAVPLPLIIVIDGKGGDDVVAGFGSAPFSITGFINSSITLLLFDGGLGNDVRSFRLSHG